MSSLHTREQWRDVPFGIWKELYAVSSNGRVKNKRTGAILSPTIGKAGYASVTLKAKPHKWCITVHTLLLWAFKGPPPSSKHECCHGNSNRSDNSLRNLRWGTRQENAVDKIFYGTSGRKLAPDQVKTIKAMILNGQNDHAISKLFNVASQTITNIREGKSYFV